MTFGEYVAENRNTAGLSLRAVADALRVSVPFLHDVEHDRRSLRSEHWDALAKAIPGMTLEALIEASIESKIKSGIVTVNVCDASAAERAVIARMLRRMSAREVRTAGGPGPRKAGR